MRRTINHKIQATNPKWYGASSAPVVMYDGPEGAGEFLVSVDSGDAMNPDFSKPEYAKDILWTIEFPEVNAVIFKNNHEYRYGEINEDISLDIPNDLNDYEDIMQVVFTPTEDGIGILSSASIQWSGFDTEGEELSTVSGYRYSILFIKLKNNNTIYANVMRF